MSPSKRQDRQAARQRVGQAQKRQRHRQLREAEPCPFERERMLAREEREMQGYVDVGRNRPFYLREIGLNDVNRGPFPEQRYRERVPVIRRRP